MNFWKFVLMETAKVHSDEFQQFQKITHCLYTELVDKKTSHFFKKKTLFKFKKNSKGTLLFQELHFLFSDPFWSQKFWRWMFMNFDFFFLIDINWFCYLKPKNICWFFFVKLLPLQQSPEAKILISVSSLRDQKICF